MLCSGPCSSFGKFNKLRFETSLASDSIPQCSYLKVAIATSDYSSLALGYTLPMRGICGIHPSRQIARATIQTKGNKSQLLSETRRRCHYKISPKLGLEILAKDTCSPRRTKDFVKQSYLDCEWLCRVLLMPNSSRVDARVQSLSLAASANKCSTMFLPGAIQRSVRQILVAHCLF